MGESVSDYSVRWEACKVGILKILGFPYRSKVLSNVIYSKLEISNNIRFINFFQLMKCKCLTSLTEDSIPGARRSRTAHFAGDFFLSLHVLESMRN